MTRKILAALTATTLIALCGCDKSNARPSAPSAAASANPVIKTVQVSEQAISDVLQVPAKVQPDPAKVIRIFPPASGKVISLQVRPGDHVRAGQTIAILESSDIASARSDFEKAKVEEERSSQAEKRALLLYQHQVLAGKDFEDAKAHAAQARSEEERAGERLQMLGVSETGTSDRIRLTAPRSGVVLDVSASPGELSKSLDNASQICTIADLSTVWVLGDVLEKDVASAVEGTPVSVTLSAYPNARWRGRISSVGETLDPTTRTLKVRVVLQNTGHRLKPEMFGAIEIARPAHGGVVVPASAVIHENGSDSVFVQQRDGKYERRTVQTGDSKNNTVEIKQGVSPGESVVSEGAELLRGGTTEP